MQRLLLIGALLVAFGGGMLAGGMLPAAKADPNPTLTQTYPAPGVRSAPGTPYYLSEPFVYQRWFVTLIPRGVNESPMVVLVDSQTGFSYLLRPAPGEPSGLAWELINRRN